MKYVVARALLIGALIFASAPPAAASESLFYILPNWADFKRVSPEAIATEVQRLRSRIGEGGPVRVGFTVYIDISMDQWPIATESQAAAALTSTIAQIDQVIAQARVHRLPVALSFVTAVRDIVDPAQTTSQTEDRRTMQWYSDNSLVSGWWSHSRYARRQRAMQELYIRALGRIVANRMAMNPDIVVAASGDAEVELAFAGPNGELADYSPFAIAEFRDWLRGEGLYGAGQPFAADAHPNAARYRGDAAPNVDSNGDGRTFNTDYGTAFTSWTLRYFDWSLSDPIESDPRAIPASVYTAPDFNPLPDAGATLFDAPRAEAGSPPALWSAWLQFRQLMVWRHNIDFSRWMTTSPDAVTGLTVPAGRWYSNQIPADYLFGHTPGIPNQRLISSASPYWTSDVRPYGSPGITSFNTRTGDDVVFRTLSGVAPLLTALSPRWAILEWNPSVPASPDPQIYREDMNLVARYRPTLVAPFGWEHPDYPILGSGFEIALQELVGSIRQAPWALDGSVLNGRVSLRWAPPDLGTAPDAYQLEVGTAPGATNIITFNTGSRSTIFESPAGPGTYYIRVRARRGSALSVPSNEIRLEISSSAPPAPSGLVATIGLDRMVFNWLAPISGTPPTGYVIEAGSAPGLANLATIRVGPSTTFVVRNVPAGSYFVRVRAESSGVAGPASSELRVTTPVANAIVPCTPVHAPGPISYRITGSLITLEWQPALHGLEGAAFSLQAGSAPNTTNIAALPLGASRSFSVTAPPGEYYVQVLALNPCGVAGYAGPPVRLVVP